MSVAKKKKRGKATRPSLPDAIFLPYQAAWIADKSSVKCCEKSRRTGLTWAQAADDVLTAATRGRKGMDVLYISFNQSMTREYIKTCVWWVERLGLLAREVSETLVDDPKNRGIKAFQIDFVSGHSILALSSRPANLRGKQGRVVIDEAAFVEDLPELLKAALALLMWGGQVVLISTHNGAENPFCVLINDMIAGRLPYSHHRITLDDALQQGLYQRMCQVQQREWSAESEQIWRERLIQTYGDGADEELFCIPRRSDSVWLSAALVESCMDDIPVLRWKPPAENFVDWSLEQSQEHTRNWCEQNVHAVVRQASRASCPHFIGVDFARSSDISVFWVLAEQQDLSLQTVCVLELHNAPFRTQEQILFFLATQLPGLASLSMDARGNGQALAEYMRQQLGHALVHEIMFTENWYREHMPRLKAALEDHRLTLPRDSAIRHDLCSLRIIRGIARAPEKRSHQHGQKQNRHADAAIALALALHAQSCDTAESWECETLRV